jgi:hypothetical protein
VSLIMLNKSPSRGSSRRAQMTHETPASSVPAATTYRPPMRPSHAPREPSLSGEFTVSDMGLSANLQPFGKWLADLPLYLMRCGAGFALRNNSAAPL